ncbi:MAG: hypothetical protein L0Y72_02290 [Gemmataceae bacterium]|nr:hypothetical protein [Gemmataceae bacterium]MCI0737845.1 hypothetical protein [Gemmataceae bacterium]
MDSPTKRFRTDQLARVSEQIRNLVERADKLGIKQQTLQSLTSIVDKLESNPLSFVDPTYRTRKQGGLTCYGIEGPLVVHCVVYQIEKVVLVLDIKPVPGSKLEQS